MVVMKESLSDGAQNDFMTEADTDRIMVAERAGEQDTRGDSSTCNSIDEITTSESRVTSGGASIRRIEPRGIESNLGIKWRHYRLRRAIM